MTCLVEIRPYIRRMSLSILRDWLVPSYIKNANSTFPHWPGDDDNNKNNNDDDDVF